MPYKTRACLFAAWTALLVAVTPSPAVAQAPVSSSFTPAQIAALVQSYRADDRGPFQAIKWYCPDGSVISAQSRCATPGGIQHAESKVDVARLAVQNHVFLGQILAGTPNTDFLDAERQFSRAKQYLVERFLRNADAGWIFRKAQFYRGAVQAEDEEAWSQAFLLWMLAQNELIQDHFILARDLARGLPRGIDQDLLQRIRSVSKQIADTFPPFSSLRVKIHGQPDASDREQVRAFYAARRNSIPDSIAVRFQSLLVDLEKLYGMSEAENLRSVATRIPASAGLRKEALDLADGMVRMSQRAKVRAAANLIYSLRRGMIESESARVRLALMDVSIELEHLLLTSASSWNPADFAALVEKNYLLGKAVVGAGYLEFWEWESIEPRLAPDRLPAPVSVERLEEALQSGRRIVEWGIGMIETIYGETVADFSAFEPLTAGFTDDRLRSSTLLALGQSADQSGAVIASITGQTNTILNLGETSQMRGLNPGVAMGRLEVIQGPADEVDFQSDRIYVLARAPSELKPVAGIATVAEGNLVSHVQLLARNLGIPNAVLSPELLRALVPFSGETVFFAVSPRGAVRIKRARDMASEERGLVEARKRSEERIFVPTNRMDLTSTELTSLFALRASDSGRVCGPKAANLGQLSALFPGHVAPGFIIPFSLFRSHMDQAMPGTSGTFWQFLRAAFADAAEFQEQGMSESEIDNRVLERLAVLRSEIEKMTLRPSFVDQIRRSFSREFGSSLGSTAVFIRSDTNMEDLKDFTGAGLNLTVPNVVTEADVLQAIRRVWASPYRERGYRWRQKYLLNPEDVYPSILVLKSVNAAKSGVMITTGVSSGRAQDVTIAFNHGVGGAVDGQAAESFTLTLNQEEHLIAPAREPSFRSLPASGGTAIGHPVFSRSITAAAERETFRELAKEVRRVLPSMPGIESPGPYDLELGFMDGKLWLFQVRPFVENRNAGAMNYLQSMDARISTSTLIRLEAKLPS